MNLYLYGRASPVVMVDPNGMEDVVHDKAAQAARRIEQGAASRLRSQLEGAASDVGPTQRKANVAGLAERLDWQRRELDRHRSDPAQKGPKRRVRACGSCSTPSSSRVGCGLGTESAHRRRQWWATTCPGFMLLVGGCLARSRCRLALLVGRARLP